MWIIDLYAEAVFNACRVYYNNAIFIVARKNLRQQFTDVS